MNVAVPRLRSRLGAALAMLAALALAALLLATQPAPAPAEENPNQMACSGHIAKGEADPDDPDSGVVNYLFACSQPITGYSITSSHEVTGYETEVFAFDNTTKEIVPTDAFSCSGDIPGLGVNCTGATTGNWHEIRATFTIDGDVCREPRIQSTLVVTAATVANGKVTQHIAGPFALGRPRGCPAVKPAPAKAKPGKKAKNGKKLKRAGKVRASRGSAA